MFASALDLYRIGPGPSSAHTVGPLRAARRFVHALEADGVFLQTSRVHIDLYGSVALTGRDQNADRAIVAGLAGDSPDATDAATLAARFARVRADGVLPLGRVSPIPFDPATDLVFHVDKAFAYHSNAMRFTARSARGEALAARLYYSTGDGEMLTEGEAPDARASLRVPYMFDTGAQAHRSAPPTASGSPTSCASSNMRCTVRASCGSDSPGRRPRCALRSSAGSPPGHASRQRLRVAGTTAGVRAPGRRSPAAGRAAVYATAVAGGERRRWTRSPRRGRMARSPSAAAAPGRQWRTTTRPATDDHTVTHPPPSACWDLGPLPAGRGPPRRLPGRSRRRRRDGCRRPGGEPRWSTNAQVLSAAERALDLHLALSCHPACRPVEDPCIHSQRCCCCDRRHAARTAPPGAACSAGR